MDVTQTVIAKRIRWLPGKNPLALAAILVCGIAAAAAQAQSDRQEATALDAHGQHAVDADSGVAKPEGEEPPPKASAAEPKESGADAAEPEGEEAPKPPPPVKPKRDFGTPTFAIPKRPAEGKAAAVELPKRLTFQYGYGSESDVIYRRNPDLNSRVRDDTLIITPQLNGHFIYRPFDWLETGLEMVLDREIPVLEESAVTLPNGDIEYAAPRQISLRVEQLYLAFKDASDNFRFIVGRRNYEDERHWVFDTSLDVVAAGVKLGKFRVEALAGREVLVDLDVIGPGESAVHQQRAKRKKDLINTYGLLVDYRGIEDIRLQAYAVFRDDREKIEGQPLLVGLHSSGMPSDILSYWAELGLTLGSDEASRNLFGYGFDVGATYRFPRLPLHPNITLAVAFGSGGGNGTNHEFRQTGLQSNETKYGGHARFRAYGEVLDPELTNLTILTAGVGIHPTLNVSIDLVYHYYRLNSIATEVRNAAITALMNQVPGRSSHDVGSAVDLVFGFRHLFGLLRLGVDLRAGVFFPGDAFVLNDGGPDSSSVRSADNGFKVLARFWW